LRALGIRSPGCRAHGRAEARAPPRPQAGPTPEGRPLETVWVGANLTHRGRRGRVAPQHLPSIESCARNASRRPMGRAAPNPCPTLHQHLRFRAARHLRSHVCTGRAGHSPRQYSQNGKPEQEQATARACGCGPAPVRGAAVWLAVVLLASGWHPTSSLQARTHPPAKATAKTKAQNKQQLRPRKGPHGFAPLHREGRLPGDRPLCQAGQGRFAPLRGGRKKRGQP